MLAIYQIYFIPSPVQSKKGQESTHTLFTWSSTEAYLAIFYDPIHQYRLGTALLKRTWVLWWILGWKRTGKQCALQTRQSTYCATLGGSWSTDGGKLLSPSIYHRWGVQFGTTLFRGRLKHRIGSSRGFNRIGGMHQTYGKWLCKDLRVLVDAKLHMSQQCTLVKKEGQQPPGLP